MRSEPFTETETATVPTLPKTTSDGRARQAALHAAAVSREALGSVSYSSRGQVLVLGDEDAVLAAAAELGKGMACTVVRRTASADAGQTRASALPGVTVVRGKPGGLSGHLGDFHLRLDTPEGLIDLGQAVLGEGRAFDLVLDLHDEPLLKRELPPPGYYAPGSDPTARQAALAELPGMVGEFEKPKFFAYNPDICAHGASGITGCTRCIDACPTRAITSVGEHIEVDPHLCQGGGSCATACPTGAITYACPPVADLLGALRQLLQAYREHGGERPTLLFHDAEAGAMMMAQKLAAAPESVLPVEVEEIGSVGMESWLSALAYGAERVVLLASTSTPPSVRRELDEQLGFARAVLDGMGHAPERLAMVTVGSDGVALTHALSSLEPLPVLPPAGFAAFEEKRTNLRLAIEHLYDNAPSRRDLVDLPPGAPFGQILVDAQACTLCMACASVCPSSAVVSGDERPELRFIERNCVQCGICATACPEDAITLEARLLFDPEANGRPRLLNADQPFHCVSCGKPFATRSVMARMADKLKGHWMFQDEAAMRRIQMCDECRVKDMFAREQGPIDVHRGVPRA